MLNNQKSDASAIQVFNSPQFGEIRTAGTSEEPLFCLSDVCSVLGLRQGDVKQRLDKGVVLTQPLETAGGIQQANFVNEDGLYDVILDSRKPQAKAFRKWVTSEVLPAIRKTGGYISTTPNDTPEEIMARALTIAQATLAKREERLKQLEAETEQQQATIELQDKEIKEAAPKVCYYDSHLQSVNTQTSTQVAKQIGMDAEKLHKKLKEIGIIYKQSGQWLLHAPYSTWGMHSTRTQTYTRSDGSIGTSVYTVWTTKGVRFIIALYESGWDVKKAIKLIKGELTPAA
jgi:prophage antirepressor-like protein